MVAQLANKNARGYVPFDKYRLEYETMEIQLSNTLDKMIAEDQSEALGALAKDLALVAHALECGPKIRETIQHHYRVAFGLFKDSEFKIQGIEGMLKEAAQRAALEAIQTMIDFLLEKKARDSDQRLQLLERR